MCVLFVFSEYYSLLCIVRIGVRVNSTTTTKQKKLFVKVEKCLVSLSLPQSFVSSIYRMMNENGRLNISFCLSNDE